MIINVFNTQSNIIIITADKRFHTDVNELTNLTHYHSENLPDTNYRLAASYHASHASHAVLMRLMLFSYVSCVPCCSHASFEHSRPEMP